MFLTCLRLETNSDIQYFWSFTMQSISSSFFFLRPWCVSSLFYSKRAKFSVYISDSSMGDKLKRSIFFHRWDEKLVSTCLRLETGSNIYYFWSFTMHSKSSSNFFLRHWCTSTPFYSKGQDFLFFSGIHSWGRFKKKQFFHRWEKKWF